MTSALSLMNSRWTPSRQASYGRTAVSNEAGGITLPFALSLVALVSALLTVLGLRFVLRTDVETQRRIDQCVQKTTMKLVSIQNAIEVANLRMMAERMTIQATRVSVPPIAVVAAGVLFVEATFQLKRKIEWHVLQASWIAKRGCDGRKDLPLPLPSFGWEIPVPDSLGPKPLEWRGKKDSLRVSLIHPNFGRKNRKSYADIRFNPPFRWSGHWSEGPGFY